MATLGSLNYRYDLSNAPSSSSSSSSSSQPTSLLTDAPAPTTILSNLFHLGDLTHLTWRAYRVSSTDVVRSALSPLSPTSRWSTSSPLHSTSVLLQHTLADAWSSPSASAAPPSLVYHAQVERSPTHPILILVFRLAFDSTPPSPSPTLPGEAALSPWLVDGDELTLPLSFACRLFSSAFSSSILLLLSHALQALVQRSLHPLQPSAPHSTPLHFLLHDRSLCARILSPSHPPPPPPTQPSPLQSALSSVDALLSPLFEDKHASTVPPPPPPPAPPSQPNTPALSSPSTTLTPLSVIATPTTSSSHASDADAMEQSEPPPTDKPPPATPPTTPSPPLPRYTRPPSGLALHLPSYLHRFVPSTHTHSYSLPPTTERKGIPRSLFLVDEADVHLVPDPLADLALSSNTFPSLFPLSESTKRSLALPAAPRPPPPTDPPFTFNLSPVPFPVPPLQYPLTASTQSPVSLPELSPLLDDAGPSSSPRPPPTPAGATNRPLPPPLPPQGDPTAPFSPWAVDVDDVEKQRPSAAPAHLVQLIKQQALAPLPAGLLPRSEEKGMKQRGAWLTVQAWMDTAAVLYSLFPLPHASHVVATVSTQPPQDPRNPASEPPLPSPTLAYPSSSTPSPLPLLLIPPPRIVASFESDLREFPSSTLPLWFPAGLGPPLPKDVAYVVVPPPSFPLDDTPHAQPQPVPILPARAPLELWMEGLSSAWETAGLGRHRPLQEGRRGGTLRLRRVEGVADSEGAGQRGGERAVSTPSPPPTPASASSASPRATSPILLSASTPPPAPTSPTSSFASALHRHPAPDGRRRYYQSFVSALLAAIDTISPSTGLPLYDALIVYLITDAAAHPHHLRQLADYTAILRYPSPFSSSSAAAGRGRLVGQLEGVDMVVHALPLAVVEEGGPSLEGWVREGLAVYGKVRRGVDRVESEVELDLPAEVERVWEPPWYGGWGVGQAQGGEEGEGVGVYVLWGEVGGRVVAVGGDERGQVMEISVDDGGGRVEEDAAVERCWKECVDNVVLLIRRHRKVKSTVVHLLHWTELDEVELWAEPSDTSAPTSQLLELWAAMLRRRGMRKGSGEGGVRQEGGEVAMEVEGEENGQEGRPSSVVRHVLEGALQPTSSTQFLSISALLVPAASASTSAGSASSSSGGAALLVEGAGGVGHSMMAPYSPQWLRVVSSSPPLASLLLFPSPPSDPRQPSLNRFLPPRLPVDAPPIGLLLSLQAEWTAWITEHAGSEVEWERRVRWAQQLERIGTQLLRSVVLLPPSAVAKEEHSGLGRGSERGEGGDGHEGLLDGVALPLYVTVLRRAMRLVEQAMK